MSSSVTIAHNFETGHRLPILPGKCQNLHGHSWWAEITVTAPATAGGVVVEFGKFKKAMRGWIDTYLDHGLMLGAADPLLPHLRAEGKVFVFDTDTSQVSSEYTMGLAWPTVENVATMLARVAAAQLDGIERAPGTAVTSVTVRETHVNAATWTAAA